ncbi:hypothetical protein TcG_03278 [Trypanosoma cruzi]|nr:hypothetical protein TcG_03278 [Trypanosoma cruzi]
MDMGPGVNSTFLTQPSSSQQLVSMRLLFCETQLTPRHNSQLHPLALHQRHHILHRHVRIFFVQLTLHLKLTTLLLMLQTRPMQRRCSTIAAVHVAGGAVERTRGTTTNRRVKHNVPRKRSDDSRCSDDDNAGRNRR